MPETPPPTGPGPNDPGSDSESPTVAAGGTPVDRQGEGGPLGPGRRLGDFEIVSELGRGGMGIVFEARQVSLNRRVALKLLPPGLGMTEDSVKRFEREAQTAAKLHHTNIVPVYAIGSEAGSYFYAMELVEGQSLAEILKSLRGGEANPLMEKTVAQSGGSRASGSAEAPAPPAATQSTHTETSTGRSGRAWFDTVAKLMADVGDALHYAHGRGVIHRDIKPGNLMLADDGRLCVMDFGLARVAQEPGMTVTGSFMGTPAYMSPEQIAAGRITVDQRSDIYSLGAVLYEMLTFHRPFPGESRDEILTGIMTRDPQAPRKINPRVPLDLETICLKAMEKDPSRRYQSADEFANDLRQFLNRGLIAARRASLPRRAMKFARHHPVPVTVGVAAVVFVVGILGVTRILSAQKSSEAALRHVADARYHLSQGQYAVGLEAANEALKRAPDLDEANIIKARLLMRMGRASEAVQQAQKVIDKNPREWTAHLIMAMAAKDETSGEQQIHIDAEKHLKVVEEEAPETADAYYVRGLLATSGREALELLDRALSLDPGHTEALTERIYRHEELKNYPAAMQDAERLTALEPRSARGRQLIGWIHAQQFDYDGALAAYQKAEEIDPEDPITFRLRTEVLDERGRYPEALESLNRAVELQPEYVPSLVQRGWVKMRLGMLDEAEADAARVIELQPEFPEVYALQYFTYRAQGRVGELPGVIRKIKDVSASWADDRAKAQLNSNLALGSMETGDLQAALAMADTAVMYHPEGPHGYAVRGLLKRMTGDPAAAAADCDRCAEIDLTEPEAYRERAEALRSFCGRREQAIADLTRAIELAPAWAALYNERGHLQRNLRRWEEAYVDYSKAIELAPKWGAAFNNRAIVLVRQGRLVDALADYGRCIEAGEDSYVVRSNRAQVLSQLGRYDDALLEADHLNTLEPESNRAHRLRGDIQVIAGRMDEAMAAYRAGAEKDPTNFPILLRMAIAQALRGECDQAVATLDKALSLAPEVESERMQAVIELHAMFLPRVCPKLAKPRLALDAANRMLAFGRQDPTNLLYAGMAQYRSGQYRQALEMLEQSLAVDERRPRPRTLFLLAMVRQRLGQKEKALQTYKQGVARLEENHGRDVSRILYRDEAAEVLGIRGAERALRPSV